MPRTSRFIVEFEIPSQPGKLWVAETVHQHAKESCPHKPAPNVPGQFIRHEWLECSHHDVKGRPAHADITQCDRVRRRFMCPAPLVTPIQFAGPDGKILHLRHLTTIKLRHKGASTYLTGTAPCSIRDEYNWHHGLHYALQRALEKGKFCRLLKRPECCHIDTETRGLMHTNPKDCPEVGKIVIVSRTPTYDEVVEAFWRESRLRPVPGASEGGAMSSGGTLGTPSTVVPASTAPQATMLLPGHGMGAVETPPENRWGLGYCGFD